MSAADADLRDNVAAIFDRPGAVGIAVSGGGDSMALLDLALRIAAERGRELAAVTVDHGLRPGAAAEARAVSEHCRRRGVEHAVLRWAWDGAGNLPARARAARYRLVGDWAARRGLSCVALGHTRDDVAENVLIRLRRAPGVDGLARMPDRFRRDGTEWRRPLLAAGRADLRAYLLRRGIAWAEDPSNEDPAFDRSRARRLLEALRPLGVEAEALAATAGAMRAAREALDHYAAQEAGRVAHEDRGDLLLQRAPEPLVPAEIDRRILESALLWVGGATTPPRHAALAALVAALTAGRARTLCGCRVSPEGTRWRIAREAAATRGLAAATDALWDGRWRLSGPHAPDLHVAALGEAVSACPGWRATGLPRTSLMAGPAVWRGGMLLAAPLAGLGAAWRAEACGRGKFAAFRLGD